MSGHCTREIAQGQQCVLIVDQLDAISLVSGRKTNTWTAFEELLRTAAKWPAMKVIIACRSFDLNQDHRLRPLGAEPSVYRKIIVARLTEPQLRASLDQASLSDFKPSQQQTEILTLPFHLTLFLQGYPERPFQKIGDLYANYWERKQDQLKAALGRDSKWNDVTML